MELLIIDTADCTMKRKSDGHLSATAEAQLASIAQSLGINEKVFGGIGNKALAVIQGQKQVTSSLRNAFFNLEFLSMTQGVAIDEAGNATVNNREDGLTVVDNSGTLEVTITGTPVGTTAHVINSDGEVVASTIATNKVTVPVGHAIAGDLVSVIYKIDVTGDIVTFDTGKFPEAYEIEFHTIGYDPKTNRVVKDIYIQLDHVIPSSEFELSLENGKAIAPEIKFDALAAPNSKEIGRIIEVDRV